MRLWQGRLQRSTFLCPLGYRWVREEISTADWWYAAKTIHNSLPSAESYLQNHSEKYSWGPAFLRHGKRFEAPSEKTARVCMVEGKCYSNALLLAERILRTSPDIGKEIFYVEGIAVDPTGAYPHAWCVCKGEVIDPTWPGSFLATYFGVPFEVPWAVKISAKVGWYGMIDRWEKFSEPVSEYLQASR